MENKLKPPAIAEYLACILAYCPDEGAFYSTSVYQGEPKGELNGVVIYGPRQTVKDKSTGRLLIRAGNRYGRRSVHAAKLAWYMTYGEWPYFMGHRYGLDDLRIMGLKAIMTPDEYLETLGDITYWQRSFAAMPALPAERECKVVWYPGQEPGIAEV